MHVCEMHAKCMPCACVASIIPIPHSYHESELELNLKPCAKLVKAVIANTECDYNPKLYCVGNNGDKRSGERFGKPRVELFARNWRFC